MKKVSEKGRRFGSFCANWGRQTILVWLMLTVIPHGASGKGLPASSCCEVRGAWLNEEAFSSEANRRDVLRKMRQANFNTLFLIAPPIKNNRGWSMDEAFSAMLKESTSLGLSVHAWIASSHRVSGGVDFTLAEEPMKQAQWASDILEKYPALDGIHFDYIRYKEWADARYDKMESVSKVIRVAFQEIKLFDSEKFLTAAVFTSAPNPANYEREYLPGWFRGWMRANPRNSYTTFFNLGGRYVPQGFKYQQDAIGWLREGSIDAIIPMEYTTDDSRWQENVRNWLSFRQGNPDAIFVGLGWRERKGPDSGYDASGIVRKIKYGRQLGLRGFVIFELSAFRGIDRELVEVLSVDSVANDFHAPFKIPIRSCISKSSNAQARCDRLQ